MCPSDGISKTMAASRDDDDRQQEAREPTPATNVLASRGETGGHH